MEQIEKFIVTANTWVVGLMMVVMFILVFTNVVTRYCFGFSIATAEEISTFLMIWTTYLGAGLALRQGRHAAINLFQDLFDSRFRRKVRIVIGMILIAFCGFLLLYGILFARFGWGLETIATQIPKGIPYLGIPIGAGLFIVHLCFIFRKWLDQEWEGGALLEDLASSEGER